MAASAEPSSSATTSSKKRGYTSLFAIIAGFAIETVILAIAYWIMAVLSKPGFNSLIYSWTVLGIGSFLTGLAVGFLIKYRASGAGYGFLCALVPTLVFSWTVGRYSWNPIGWYLLVILFVPLDVPAALSGFLGTRAKPKIVAAVTAVIIIVVTIVAVAAYYAAVNTPSVT